VTKAVFWEAIKRLKSFTIGQVPESLRVDVQGKAGVMLARLRLAGAILAIE